MGLLPQLMPGHLRQLTPVLLPQLTPMELLPLLTVVYLITYMMETMGNLPKNQLTTMGLLP